MGAQNRAAHKVTRSRARSRRRQARQPTTPAWRPKGRAGESKGDLKQAGEKVKDVFKK
jgi:hypothetical protein